MSGSNVFRKLGMAIDRRYLKKAGAIPIPGSEARLLLICFHPYHGSKSIEIPGQVTIAPGDPVCELHFSNHRITEIAAENSDRSMEWLLMEMLKKEFKTLAESCVNGAIPREIKAFYGVNVMGTTSRRLGFTLIPLPKGWNRLWLGFWESLLRKIFYSYKKDKKTVLGRTMDPHEIWISRDELTRRYFKP
jgi:hypothetical protein